LPSDAERFECVVFGLNPGEQPANWTAYPGPTKETIDFDWLDVVGRSQSSKRWRKNVQFYSCGRPTLTSDFFFWSTSDTGKAFTKRFGYRFLKSPHFEFCRDVNLRMVDGVGARVVLAPGLSTS